MLCFFIIAWLQTRLILCYTTKSYYYFQPHLEVRLEKIYLICPEDIED